MPFAFSLDHHAELRTRDEKPLTSRALVHSDSTPLLGGHLCLALRTSHRVHAARLVLWDSARRADISLRVPRLLRAVDHPYFDNDGLPLAFAHRGGGAPNGHKAAGLENSLAAFQAAVDLGYRYVETDVQATRDGVLVAFHDATLARVTGTVGRIRDLEYDDLRQALIAGREPIPTLDLVLATWPQLRVNIDAKTATAVAPLAATIARHRAWDRVCVASFSPRHLREMRRLLGPRVATAYSAVGVAALRLLPAHRLRAQALGRFAQAAQVPVRHGHLRIVTPTFIDSAHRLGKQVHVWTVDSADEIVRLLDMGVDAIMTDRIDVLRTTYQSRGIWREEGA